MAEPFLSEIRIFSFRFAPKGWALCEGQLLPINQNQALFSLLGTYYGGDGKSTFALPDLRGRVPLDAGQGAGLSNYAIGTAGGEESVKLAVGQLPSHAHPVRANSGPSTTKEPAGAFPAKGGAYAAA